MKTKKIVLLSVALLALVAGLIGAQAMHIGKDLSLKRTVGQASDEDLRILSDNAAIAGRDFESMGNETNFSSTHSGSMMNATLAERVRLGQNTMNGTGSFGSLIISAIDQIYMDDVRASKLDTKTKAAELRVLLSQLNREHTMFASEALRNGFDQSPDYEASRAQLLQNSDELAASVTAVYGEAAGAEFLEIWNSHILYFIDYTVAARNNDTAGQEQAVRNLEGYVDRISLFFAKANPYLPREVVHAAVTDHVELLKGTIDAYFDGEYDSSYGLQHEQYNQIGSVVADTVSGAIVKQFPERFE